MQEEAAVEPTLKVVEPAGQLVQMLAILYCPYVQKGDEEQVDLNIFTPFTPPYKYDCAVMV